MNPKAIANLLDNAVFNKAKHNPISIIPIKTINMNIPVVSMVKNIPSLIVKSQLGSIAFAIMEISKAKDLFTNKAGTAPVFTPF